MNIDFNAMMYGDEFDEFWRDEYGELPTRRYNCKINKKNELILDGCEEFIGVDSKAIESFLESKSRYIAERLFLDFGREALQNTKYETYVANLRSCYSESRQCNIECPNYNGGNCNYES